MTLPLDLHLLPSYPRFHTPSLTLPLRKGEGRGRGHLTKAEGV